MYLQRCLVLRWLVPRETAAVSEHVRLTSYNHARMHGARACVCVCENERERERESVSVCLCNPYKLYILTFNTPVYPDGVITHTHTHTHTHTEAERERESKQDMIIAICSDLSLNIDPFVC